MTRTKEYRAWSHAKGRCHDTNDPKFRIYGAMGIIMHPNWRNSFETFIADMGMAPSAAHTLERVNRLGNYEAGNCVWADRITQANNTSTNVFVNFRGVEMTISECARVAGVDYKSFHYFHRARKMDLESALAHASPRR